MVCPCSVDRRQIKSISHLRPILCFVDGLPKLGVLVPKVEQEIVEAKEEAGAAADTVEEKALHQIQMQELAGSATNGNTPYA